jgi:hypothetical protein
VLNRISPTKFKNYIKKIALASSNDILFNGYIGCASEVSSAAEQKSEGCLSQAWSNAMFVELMDELEK